MVEISKIIEQNPWWRFGKDFVSYDSDMKKYREARMKIERKLKDIALNPGNIYAIHGPRRVGKTTEIKKTILKLIEKNINPESICYFSCETLASRKELRKVLDFFLDKTTEHEKIYMFLDEINFIKDWVPEVKSIADSDKFSKVMILFTGSPFGMKVHTHELIGRNIEGNRYLMKPLSFRDFVVQICRQFHMLTSDASLMRELEILHSHLGENVNLDLPPEGNAKILKGLLKFTRSLNFLFDIYLKTGGFPAIINEYLSKIQSSEKEKIGPQFYEMFIDAVAKDTMKQGKDMRIMEQILSAVIKRVGSRYDFRTVTEETEEHVSHPTVIEYLKLLEDNFITHIIYSYDFSKKAERYRGSKKIYFSDPFIFHSFNSWLYGNPGYSFSQESLLKEDTTSLIVEAVIQNHLAKIKEIPVRKPADRFVWFYYDVRKELDFVYKKDNGEYLGIEVKYKQKVTFKDAAVINPVKEYFILSKDEFEISGNTLIVPVSLFLCLLQNSEKNL